MKNLKWEEYFIFINLKYYFIDLVSKKLSKRIIKFSFVGLIALLFESVLLFILHNFGIDPVFGRIISLPLAIILTWLLNRRITFRNKNPQKIKQLLKYFIFVITGMSINYLAYLLVIDLLKNQPFSYLIAICFGSASSMSFNFLSSNFIIFKE